MVPRHRNRDFVSIRIMADVWDNSPMEGRALLIELALADFANDEGVCWPAIETLSLKARCSESWVHQVIRDLRRAGRIKALEGGGRGRTNLYMFTLNAGEKGVTNTPLSEQKGAVGSTKRVQSVEKRVHPTAPRTVIEPLGDPSTSLEREELPFEPKARKVRHVTEEDLVALQAKNPDVDVRDCWEQAQDWCKANGKTKQDYVAFLRGWVRREAKNERERRDRLSANRAVSRPGAQRQAGSDVVSGWDSYAAGAN